MFGRAPDPKKRAQRRFRIVQSQRHDPFYNLSLEESLFSNYKPEARGGEEMLLLYVNSRAVVLGKHQNPWKECDLHWLWEQNIPLLRRFSGGGAVFHDLGNLLWCFIGPQEQFSQEENLLIVRDALSLYSGFPASDFSFTPRGDIFHRGFKISGNALAFSGNKALHHGTLLLHSDIDALARSLKGLEHSFDLKFDGPQVESRPAPVASLFSPLPLKLPDLTKPKPDGLSTMQEVFLLALKKSLRQNTAVFCQEDEVQVPTLVQTRHASPEWRLERTPPFRILLKTGPPISVSKGLASLNEDRCWNISTPEGLRGFEDYLSMT